MSLETLTKGIEALNLRKNSEIGMADPTSLNSYEKIAQGFASREEAARPPDVGGKSDLDILAQIDAILADPGLELDKRGSLVEHRQQILKKYAAYMGEENEEITDGRTESANYSSRAIQNQKRGRKHHSEAAVRPSPDAPAADGVIAGSD